MTLIGDDTYIPRTVTTSTTTPEITWDEMKERIKQSGETERQTIEAAEALADKWRTREQRAIGKGVKFERIRRITGYLVGTTDRFNNAKQAEERDRVKHGMPEGCSACDK